MACYLMVNARAWNRSRLEHAAGSLHHQLHHQDAGEDREGRKVVRQVFLGEADLLEDDDVVVRLLEDAVDQIELHALSG